MNDTNVREEQTNDKTDPYDGNEAPTEPPPSMPKARASRAVDYTRTDKRPHSFRYKRGSTFVPRTGAVVASKEADGALVLGPVTEGDTAEIEGGSMLELVAIRKRPNGKTAIAFRRMGDGAEVVAYDARHARAALKAKGR